MKATLQNNLQSSRKTRLVTDLVRGKSVSEALDILKFLKRKSAEPVSKLIVSAVANAKQDGVTDGNLIIENITVDKGITLKRFRPRWRGMVSPLRKERSHITVTLKSKKTKEKKK